MTALADYLGNPLREVAAGIAEIASGWWDDRALDAIGRRSGAVA